MLVANFIDNLAKAPKRKKIIYVSGLASQFISLLQKGNGLSDDEIDEQIASIRAERRAAKVSDKNKDLG